MDTTHYKTPDTRQCWKAPQVGHVSYSRVPEGSTFHHILLPSHNILHLTQIMEMEDMGIATAMSFCLEDDYTRMSSMSNSSHVTSVSDDSVGAGAGHYIDHGPLIPEYPTHSQVMDVLLHKDEDSGASETEYYTIHPQQQCSSQTEYYSTHDHDQHQVLWLPDQYPAQYPVNMKSLTPPATDQWENEKPKHNILLQRNHTKRKKVGVSKAGASRFEDDSKREEYKKAACERERARMKDCNKIFAQLRAGLPLKSTKRVSKIETLRMAIRYIKHLRNVLSYPPGYQIPDHLLQFDPYVESD